MLYTAIPWEYLPQELGFGSGMTCWRRLRDWNDAGVWQRLHEVLLGKLRAADQLDMSRAVIDGSHVRALKGGPKPARARSTTASQARKHHVITDAGGIPLAATLTGGNRHDVTQLLPLIDKIPRIKGIRGRPRQRPERLYADRGYDYDCYRRDLRPRGHHRGHRPPQHRPRLRTRHPTVGRRAAPHRRARWSQRGACGVRGGRDRENGAGGACSRARSGAGVPGGVRKRVEVTSGRQSSPRLSCRLVQRGQGRSVFHPGA